MEQLSPQLMHKLVFTVLMHGLTDAQTNLALKVLTDALDHTKQTQTHPTHVALADLPVPAQKRVAALMIAMSDESSRVRRRAARALGDQGPATAAAMGVLIAGLKDEDPSVRRDCAGALGRLGPTAAPAMTGLLPMLVDPETRTRAVVAVSMKRIGIAAISTLLEGLKSPMPEMRGRCAGLLMKMAGDDEKVVATVQETLTNDIYEVRAMADEALQFVSTPPPVPMPAARTALATDAAHV